MIFIPNIGAKLYFCFYELLERGPSWEAGSSSAYQSSCIVWDLIYDCVHRTLPLYCFPSHMNQVHNLPSYIRSIVISSANLCLGHQNSLFHQNPICISLFCHACNMPSQSHSWFDPHNYIYQGMWLMKLIIVKFSLSSWYFCPFFSSTVVLFNVSLHFYTYLLQFSSFIKLDTSHGIKY